MWGYFIIKYKIGPDPPTQKEIKITQDPPLAFLEEQARMVTSGSSGSGALAPGKHDPRVSAAVWDLHWSIGVACAV